MTGGCVNPTAVRISVRGVVQGVGFRPFVYSLAARRGVRGWVRNTSAGVEVLAEGAPADVAGFAEALPLEAPPRSHIAGYEVREVPPGTAVDGPAAGASFVILESAEDPGAYQLVSPDIATCDDCRRELLDPEDRRHGYPFTNCTNCGPRFTIIEGLPYDRERTTMRHFPLCPACRREYEDPSDRRFHAEPNACPVCGPRVRLVRVEEQGGADGAPADRAVVELAAGAEGDPAAPIRAAAELLQAGEILAVKGLGGFHLACDATDGDAVGRLKLRKRRPDKPLAVMFKDLDELRVHCRVSPEEEALLTSPEHPIVLLEWREIGPDGEPGPELGAGGRPRQDAFVDEEAPVDVEVAVRQRYLGAMLPYTPLHILLLRCAGRPLVMTSGNLAEEPIVKGWEEIDRLTTVADAYLVHDREIAVRYDDSVAQVRAGRPRLIRRSRGYAPFPVALPRPLPQTLAAGAELKNTFCVTRDANAFLSQHIGDLENLETLEHYEAGVEIYRRLFRVEPEVIAYDLHPEYLATKYALALPHPEKVAVQHHHAHIAARLVEHLREEAVIGVSMDGLGYGDDGRLWGGEVLVCDLTGYRRVAHLDELPLPGGAAAITNPWRTALGWSYALLGEEGLERAARLLGRRAAGPPDEERAAVVRQIDRGINTPLTTSCGRLFDAVAALAGVRHRITYEGQAAIELEMMASGTAIRAAEAAPYEWSLDGDPGAAARAPRTDAAGWVAARAAVSRGAGDGLYLVPPVSLRPSPAVVRLAPLMAGVLADLEAGAAPGVVGARLHATVAALVLDLCRRIRAATGLSAVALAGGVFQNRLLAELCSDELAGAGFQVLGAGLVPVNDGGVSLGQAAVAGYSVLQRRGELG